MRFCFALFFLSQFTLAPVVAQKKLEVEILTTGVNTSIRGMSIPSNKIIWVSGSNGTVGKSVDAGKTWRWLIIPGFEKKDFRDIEAFDSSTALAMAIDNPAYIVKTTDGGATWRKVFEHTMEGMFLDAMDFKNETDGICIGDPVKMGTGNRLNFYIIRTYDGGESWKEVPMDQLPAAFAGEAIFSASGTNIYFLNHPDFEYAFVTGGLVSRLHLIARQGAKSKSVTVPVIQGKGTTGSFSMATDKKKMFYCIGGDYKTPKDSSGNYFFTNNTGDRWRKALRSGPFGYRSCVRIIKGKMLVSCGSTGVDFAVNGQKEWKKASTESFNVCMVSKGKQVFLAGEKGKIGRLIYK